jgi:hypothetical protein
MGRKKKWFLGTLLLLGIAVAIIAIIGARGKSWNEKRVLALRQAGLPTSPAELDEWYWHPPDSENAALLVEQAIEEYHRGSVEFPSTPPPGDALSAADLEEVAKVLDNNQPAFQKLVAASNLKESRYPIDLTPGFNALLPHLAKVKQLVQLLCAKGIFEVSKKDYRAAADTTLTSFALSRTLRNEPLLISELVRIACVAITVRNLEYLLNRGSFTKEELQAFDHALTQAEADGRRGAFRATAGEQAGILPYLTTMSGMQLMQKTGGPKPSSSPIWDAAPMVLRKLLGIDTRDLRLYLELMDGYSAAATNDFPEMLRQADQINTEFDQRLSHGLNRFAVFTRLIQAPIGKAYQKEAALAVWLREARVACAVEQYRLANNGTPPENLDVLTPTYLKSPLVDAVEAKPFQYRKLPSGGYEITSPIANKLLKNPLQTTFTVRR